jgi:hypothetical protein
LLRRDFHVEDANVFILEYEVMMRLGGDLDRRGRFGRQQGGEENTGNQQPEMHREKILALGSHYQTFR